MSIAGCSIEPVTLRELRCARRSLKAHLLSILEDSKVVIELKTVTKLPLLANIRNGLWYSPTESFSSTCYFKSTDGHDQNWKFSLTRMNLHVALLAASSNGCIVVDSTRRGKKFPDSLYSTIPIWMSVVNSILFPGLSPSDAFESPPWMPASIRAQIVSKIPEFVSKVPCACKDIIKETLRAAVSLPMRPIWVSPGEDGVLEWEGVCANPFFDNYLHGESRS